MACKEALLWEDDTAIRKKLLDQEQLLTERIDDVLSTAYVTKRTDAHGRTGWPWLHG